MENWWEEDAQANPVGSDAPAAAQGSAATNWWESDAKVEAKQTLDGNALSRGLSRGADMAGQFYGSALESLGKATGLESLEESGRARAARNRAELQASTPSMTTEDIDGLGSGASFVGEKLGETALPMGTSILAATGAGAAAGAAFGGVGAIPGALIGAGAATLANLPYMFGSFRERQKDEDIANKRPIEVDEGTALMYALPASALDSVSDLFIVGKLGKVFKPLLESKSLLTRVTTNAATGATVESLTEVGQTVLERHQAGLSLTDDEAQNEYFEAAVAGGLIGGGVSGAMNVRAPKAEVEDTAGGTDAAQRSALRGDTTSTTTSDVDPDQAAALGGEKLRGVMDRLKAERVRRTTADPASSPKSRLDPNSDDYVAPGRKTPAPAPASDLSVEERLAANQQAAVDLNVTARPVVTPEVTPAPVSEPTEQVEIPTEQVAAPAAETAALASPAQGGAVQAITGYEGANPDAVQNRMARLDEIINDEAKPERVRREAVGRRRQFEAYISNRDALLDENGIEGEQRAAVLSLVPGDVITSQTDDGYEVTGKITGWGNDGLIGLEDVDGFNHGALPHTVTNIRRGAQQSFPDMSPMDEALQFTPNQGQAAPAATPEVTAAPELNVTEDGAVETVPESREQIDAQLKDMLDPKNPRVAVFVPFGGYMPAKPDLGFVGKVEVKANKETGDEAGIIFYNSRKKLNGRTAVGKALVKIYESEGRRNELLGLGPYNKSDVAQSGGEQAFAVREINAKGTPVKEAGGTENTVDDQTAALEAQKGEGSKIEVVSAEQALNERQDATSQGKGEAARATGKRRSQDEAAPVRTLKDFDPEEIARIEAAVNVKPAPKPEAPKPATTKADEAKAVSKAKGSPTEKRVVVIKNEETERRNQDAYDEQQFLRKRAALEEETRVKKEQELADKKVELNRKIAENDFKDVEDEAVSRIEANRTDKTKDAGRDQRKVASAVKAGRLVEQLRASLQAVTGSKAGFRMINTEGDTDAETGEVAGDVNFIGAKTLAKQFRAILLEAKKQAIQVGKAVDDTVASPMAFLIDLRTQAVKLEKLPSIMDQSVRFEILAEVNTAIQDLNAYLVGNDATGIRERRLTEGGLASEGVGGVDFDSFADERSELDRDEEVDETDPDDYELLPSEPDERVIEVDETIPTYTAGQNKVPANVVIRKDRSARRAAARAKGQEMVRERMEAAKAAEAGSQLTLDNAEKPLGKDSAEKLVENLRPDDFTGMEVIDRITSAGKPLGDMTLAERRALFQGLDGVDPMKVEESLAIAKVTLSRLQLLFERQAFLRNLVRDLKFMDKIPAAVQKLLGTKLLDQMNKIAGNIEVLVVDDSDMAALAPGKEGYFWPRGDYIVIRASLFESDNAARFQHTITHEAGHAALWHAIRDNGRLRGQLEAVLGAARKVADSMGIQEFGNGLRNVDEFASELISNARFQEFLATVTLSKADLAKAGIKSSLAQNIRTALDAIKLKLMEAIGWQDALRSVGMDPDAPNALTAGLDVIGNLLEDAPRARAKFEQMIAGKDGAPLPMDADNGIHGRLKQRGLDETQALNVAAMIDEELGGTVTDEELDVIVGALGKPVASQQGLTGPSPFIPPKLPSRVTKLLGGGNPKAGPLLGAKLYVMTLDFIDSSFRKYFGDKAGNALTDYVNAAFQFKKIADDVAALHDIDAADFEDLRRTKPQEAAKIQELIGLLEAVDIDISDGATNDHLKGTNRRKYLQSKKALPEVQNILASMEPETQELVRRMAANYKASHDTYIEAVTYNILESLDTKLSNSDLMRIIDHTVNGKLDAQDKLDVNNDEIFNLLERSEMLKKRKGSYFPAERFGKWVVTTDIKIADPKITSVVTKSGRKNVPITTEIDGGTVRFTFDYAIRGSRGAVTKKVYDWVAQHELPLQSYVVRYRDRASGQIVGKGDMDITRDYDMVHEIKLQNKGVHFFESNADAYSFMEQAAKDKTAGKLLRHSDVLEKHAEGARDHLVPPGALDAVFKTIDRNAKLTEDRKTQLKNAAREAVIRNMVGNRYEKRLMGRKNVIGASDEVGRAAALYGRSVGNSIAQIRSGGERAEALGRMREIASAQQDQRGPGGVISQVVNEIVAREKLDNGPLANTQILDNLSTLNSVDKLASPANWFLNATQVPLNSLPFLGGRFGNVKAARAIQSAYKRIGAAGAAVSGLKNAGKSVTQLGKNNIDLENVLASIRKNAGIKYNDLFEALVETNDVTDNVGIENAAQLSSGRNVAGMALVKMDRAMRAMPNAIEAINRSTVAIAAYDLAVGSGKTKQEAIQYARDTLRRTQFRYDETNKSRLMRSTRALRFFFTFKQFGQGQYQMLADALGRALKDASPAERAMARKQLYTMLAVQAMTAGVFSIPGLELIKAGFMLGAALGLSDGWDDDMDKVREIMKDSWGQDITDIVSKGVLSKVLGVDLSSRISWADLIVGYPPRSGEKQDLLAWAGQAVIGPQGSMVMEMLIQGPKALIEGDYAKGLSMMLPVKVISDTVKTVGAVEDGKMNATDAVKQVLGFKSLRQGNISDETGARIRASQRKKKAEGDLIADYLNAVSRGDVARAAAAIRDYNSSLPEDGRKISIGDRSKGLEKRRRENLRQYAE